MDGGNGYIYSDRTITFQFAVVLIIPQDSQLVYQSDFPLFFIFYGKTVNK